MAVGTRVGTRVAVAVGVIVAVIVAVGMAVGSTTRFWARRVKKTAAAPTNRKKAKKPIAAGRLRVILGMELPCTERFVCAAAPAASKVAPQTRQRFAFSPRRVPQVGQIFVLDTFSCILIGAKLYH